MKCRVFLVIILVIAAAFIGRQMNRRNNVTHQSSREDVKQTYQLDTGATVEIQAINGSVEIVTADTNLAEVSIIQTADSADDLDGKSILIEHDPSHLLIRGQQSKGNWLRRLWGGGNVRHQVVLTLPRKIDLETSAVNGPLTVGEIDGGVSVSAVNGRVEVAKASGRAELKRINGNVRLAISGLGPAGLEVSAINGSIQIRPIENLNADIDVNKLNGSFSLDLPNVTMNERENRSTIRARLGTGGSPISFNRVNGNIRFESSSPSAQPQVPAPPPPPAPLKPSGS